MKRFGWQPLTDDVKRQIFGLNAARVYGVDPEAKRNPLPGHYLEKLRKAYKHSGLNAPRNTNMAGCARIRCDRAASQALHRAAGVVHFDKIGCLVYFGHIPL